MTGMEAGRWQRLTLEAQLGNIASEISRFGVWEARPDSEVERAAAADRTLELLDLTIADPRWQGRRRELCRLREVFADLCTAAGQYTVTAAMLLDYLLPFAQLARRHR